MSGGDRKEVPQETKTKANMLYEKLITYESDTLFYQEDLDNQQVADDPKEAGDLVNYLLGADLLELMTSSDGGTCFRYRTRDEAKIYSALNRDERLALSAIADSRTAGIWTATLKKRTGLHQTVLTRVLKSLESKGQIKQIKSVKQPNKKMYMLSSLEPSEEVSGGSWFAEGELDEDFIRVVAELIVREVRSRSWNEKVVYPSQEAQLLKLAMRDGKMAKAKTKSRGVRVCVPKPPGYANYPTQAQLLKVVNESEILQEASVAPEDLKQLLDVLVWDDKLERMGANTFRSVLRPEDGASSVDLEDVEDLGAAAGWASRSPGLALAEAPCGQCPVFGLCEDGSPVNARDCKYFEEWLAN